MHQQPKFTKHMQEKTKLWILLFFVLFLLLRLPVSVYTNWGYLTLSKAIARINLGLEPNDMLAKADYAFNKSLSLSPELESANLGKFKVRVQLGRISYLNQAQNEAHQYFLDGIMLIPNQAYAYVTVGQFYIYQNDYGHALQICESAPLHLQLDNVALLRCIGLSSWHLNQFDVAQNALQKAVLLEPKNAEINHWLARTYSWQGEFAKAVTYAQRSVEYSPANIWYLAHLGNVYKELGKEDMARKAYAEALAIEPENSVILEYMNNLSE